MATEIDKRVVEMQFDNKDFEKNCQASLTTLEKLKMALNFDGAKGLDTMAQAAKKIDMSNIAKGAEAVQVKFSAMNIAGMTAISELTKGFIGLGKRIWDMSFGLMKTGGMARTLKIEQANFQMKALAKNIKGITDDAKAQAALVEGMVNAASNAVQGTAYGLDAAAKTASTLMASGVTDAEEMEKYLRGVAGAAAMTGRGFEDIGDIFSTVASNGKLMTMQLRQFSSAGLNLAATLGQQMNKSEQEIMEMVQKGQIGFEDFANALSDAFGEAASKADDTFNGVTTNIQAQIKRIGQIFTDPFVEHSIPFLKEVKAAIQRLNIVVKPLGKTFEMVFGTLMKKGAERIKNLNLSRISGIIHGIENVFTSLVLIADTIRKAFVDLFPPKTLQQLQQMSTDFESFTRLLIPSKDTLNGLKEILVILLSPLKLIFNIITSLWRNAIKPLFIIMTKILGAFLKLGKALTPITTKLKEFLSESHFLDSVLQILASTIIVIVDWLSQLIIGIASLITEMSKSGVISKFLETLRSIGKVICDVILFGLLLIFKAVQTIFSYLNLDNLESVITSIGNAISFIVNMIEQAVMTVLGIIDGMASSSSVFSKMWEIIKEIYETIKAIFTGDNLEEHIASLKEKFEGLGKALKKFADDISKTMKEINAGKLLIIAFAIGVIMLVFSLVGLVDMSTKFVKSVKGITDSFVSLKTAVKTFATYNGIFQVLIGIAIAIGAVSSALKTISTIPEADLKRSATVLGVFVAALMGFAVAITLLQKSLKIDSGKAALGVLSYITGFAVSILMLASAVKIISQTEMTLEKLGSTFIIIAELMVTLAGAAILMSRFAGPISTSAISLLGFAAAIKIIVSALGQMEKLNLDEAKNTIKSFISLLLVFGGSMAIAGLSGLGAGSFLSFIGFAVSLYILLGVLKKISEYPIASMYSALINIGMLLAPLVGFIIAASAIGRIVGVGSDIFKSLSKILLSFTTLIVVMAGFMLMAGYLDQGVLNKGLGVLIIVSMILKKLIDSIMIPLAGANFSVSYSKTEKSIKSVVGMLLGLSVVLGMLSVFVKTMGSRDALIGVVPAIIVLGVVFSGIITLFSLVNNSTGSLTNPAAKTAPILACIVGILSIMSAMLLLTSFLDSENVLEFSTIAFSVMGIMTALALLADAIFGSKGIGSIGFGKHGLPEPRIKQTADEILGICLGISLILSAVALIVKVSNSLAANPKGLETLTPILILIGGVIVWATALMIAAGKITSKNFNTNMKAISMLLFGITGIIGAIGLSMAALTAVANVVPIESIESLMGALTLCLVAVLGLTMWLISKMNSYTNIGESFAVVALSFDKIVKAFVVMAAALALCVTLMRGIPWQQAIMTIVGITAPFILILGTLGTIMIAAKKVDLTVVPYLMQSIGLSLFMASAGLSLLALSMGIIAMITSKYLDKSKMRQVTNIWDEMIMTVGIIIAGMFGLTYLMRNNPVQAAEMIAVGYSVAIASSSILIMAAGISLIALSVGNLDSSKKVIKVIDSIIGVAAALLIGMGVIVGVLGNRVTLMGSRFLAIATALAIASSSILIMALAVSVLSKRIKPSNIANVEEVLGIIAAIMLGFSVVLGILTAVAANANTLNIIAIAVAFPILATSLFIIIEALLKLTEATRTLKPREMEALGDILGAMLTLFIVLAVLGAAVGTIAPGLGTGIMKIVKAFLMFSVSAAAISAAVLMFTQAVDILNNTDFDANKIANNATKAVKGIAQAIKNCAPELLTAVAVIIVGIMAILGAQQIKLAMQAVAFVSAFIVGLAAAMPLLTGALDSIFDQLSKHMQDPERKKKFEELGETIGGYLVHGIIGAFKGIAEAIAGAITDAITNSEALTKLQDLTEITQLIIDKKYYEAGQRVGEMLVDSDAVRGTSTAIVGTDIKNIEGWEQTYEEFEKLVGHSLRNMSDDTRGFLEDSQRSAEEWAEIIAYINRNNYWAEQAGTSSTVWDQMIENLRIPDEYVQYLTKEYGSDKEKILKAMTMTDADVQTVTVDNDILYGPAAQQEVHHMSLEVDGMNESIDNTSTAIDDAATSMDTTTDKAEELPTNISDVLSDVANEAKTGGAGIGEGLLSGLQDAIGPDGLLGSMVGDMGLDNTELKGLKLAGVNIGDVIGTAAGNKMDDDIKTHLDYWSDYVNEIVNPSLYQYSGGKEGLRWQYMKDEKGNSFKNADSAADYKWQEYTENMDYSQEALSDYGFTLDDVLETAGDLPDIGDAFEDIGDSTEKAKSKLDEFRDGVRDSIAQAMHGIFDEVSEQEYIDPDEMLYRMEENTRRVGEWARNIATLAARGMSEGLLNELKDMGPAGAAKVQAFVDMTDDQLKMANRRWNAANFLPDYGTKEIEQAYRDAGYNASLGFTSGIDHNAVNEAGVQTGKDFDNGVRDYLQIESPSKVMEKNGEYATQGLAKGMINPTSQIFIRAACNKIGQQIVTTIQQTMPKNKFVEMGSQMMNGLPEGWNKMLPSILSKATALAARILSVFSNAWKIKSPSRAFAEIGEYAMAGLGEGFKTGESDVDSQVTKTSDDILNQMKAQIAAITNGWSEDNVYQPVIRPVFDMEGIQTGYNDIQSWFANAQGLNLSGNLTRLTPTTTDDSSSNQQIIDAINNINNDDVVREIGNLRDDISQLQSAMTNLQVVMNTGALVGQLVDPIDSALGMKSLMNTRGRY